MWLEGLLAAAAVAAVLLAWALWQLRRAASRLAALDEALRHAELAGREQASRLAALEALRDTQQLTEHAIATGTAVVREMHKGIADIPFSVLEAIPAARAPARALRGLHDAISDGVYGALGNLNRAVGRDLRKGFEAESLASTARLGLEPRPAFGSSGADLVSASITAKRGRAGGSSEVRSLAMDGKAGAAPALPTQTDSAVEPNEEASSSTVPPPKSWG